MSREVWPATRQARQFGDLDVTDYSNRRLLVKSSGPYCAFQQPTRSLSTRQFIILRQHVQGSDVLQLQSVEQKSPHLDGHKANLSRRQEIVVGLWKCTKERDIRARSVVTDDCAAHPKRHGPRRSARPM